MTGEVLRRFDELTPGELEDKLARAAAAAASYRLTSLEERAGWLRHAADRLEKDVESVSAIVTAEMAKTFRAAEQEVVKCLHGLLSTPPRAARNYGIWAVTAGALARSRRS